MATTDNDHAATLRVSGETRLDLEVAGDVFSLDLRDAAEVRRALMRVYFRLVALDKDNDNDEETRADSRPPAR